MEDIKIIDPYGFIYITTNNINGKKYIGQKIFGSGWKRYLGSGTILLRAIKKYGQENFSREIIAIAYTKVELDELEINSIKNHDATNNSDYYNIARGGASGMAGVHVSEEARLKMRGVLLTRFPLQLDPYQTDEIRVKWFSSNDYTMVGLAKEYAVPIWTIRNVINFTGLYNDVVLL